ncbi:hypothetical protein AWM75_02630 [Aerococcus urinaehominis]|uniref:Uncharacterized protein n=1 Tax=Aerococcus urinaehominis TaxID=128944 RepID=A0A0X8FKE8_9LACT|nr:YSIRK-type signal peptide-containing protein [Aerococcus urinaehominis]AMB98958.1 hypothetical protein AWM75_02630 [Aerococcus urinaehominis]SDM36729.1 signal peptide-containing protein, YSIRK family [Aerococcus urinaehominis]
MVGKNNHKVHQEKMANKFYRYSIKRLSIGVASVAVAAGFLLNSEMVVAQAAALEGNQAVNANLETSVPLAENEANNRLTTEISSDENKREENLPASEAAGSDTVDLTKEKLPSDLSISEDTSTVNSQLDDKKVSNSESKNHSENNLSAESDKSEKVEKTEKANKSQLDTEIDNQQAGRVSSTQGQNETEKIVLLLIVIT